MDENELGNECPFIPIPSPDSRYVALFGGTKLTIIDQDGITVATLEDALRAGV